MGESADAIGMGEQATENSTQLCPHEGFELENGVAGRH